LASALLAGLTFGRVILLGKVSIGRLTVPAITTVDTKLNPNVSVIIEENDNAGTTAESGFTMSL
jgi:hypothetical protein